MRDSVRAAFPAFSERFEGSVPFMYLDVKGLVTTGIGNLVDPVEYALPLPFLKPDGTEASLPEVLGQWNHIKRGKHLAQTGHTGVPQWCRQVGMELLKLSPDGIAQLVRRKMDQNDRHLVGRFPDMPGWPADAQLFVHSMAWACGPGFRFPLLSSFLKAEQFGNAAEECSINETGNPGLIPRNVANRTLLRNASVVVMSSLDRERLWYPGTASSSEAALPGPIEDNQNSELVLGSGPVIHAMPEFVRELDQ